MSEAEEYAASEGANESEGEDTNDSEGEAKPNSGLMSNATDDDGEDDKPSDKTLEFKTDKGSETLTVPQKWVGEDGEINHAAILKSATDAGKSVRQLQNELAEAKKTGAGAKIDTENVPKDAAGYLVNSEGDDKFILDGKVQLGPDPKSLSPVPIDDPVIQLFAEVAQEEGFSAERFQRIVSRVMAGVDDAAPVLDLEAEATAFGSNAKAVAMTNKSWADNLLTSGSISNAEHVHLLNMGQTAIGLSVVNKVRVMTGGKTIPTGQTGVSGELPSKDEWYANMPNRHKDHAGYEKWRKQGEELFGTEPSGSSESGFGVPSNQGGAQSSYTGEGSRGGNTKGSRGTRR